MRWSAIHQLHAELIHVPPRQDKFARGAVHALVSDAVHPLPQFRVEVHQTGWLPTQQPTHEVSPYILYARLDLALGLRTIGPAQPRSKTPVPREVQKHRVPDDLPALVAAQPHRFHAVVQDLFRNRAPLASFLSITRPLAGFVSCK